MLLSDFQWSRNPRGMHNRDVFDHFMDANWYRSAGMGWAKLVVAEGEYLEDIPAMLQANVTPVVRVYLPRFGNARLPGPARDTYIAYARAGVKWFEFYNEPNLGVEWPGGIDPDWRDTELIAPMMANWLDWAEFIIRLGGYPGFIPLAEAATEKASAVRWMDTMLNYMANNYYSRFLNVLRGGAYCATHPYILNHFYQEKPGGGPLSARSPYEQNGEEGGWHFEYPYDPISQADDPGRTVYGGTRLTPYGDPVGLTAMGRMFNERCATLFGTQAIPVLGTEGGIWDWPAGDGIVQQDDRYPPYTNASHAEATLAMFNWLATQSPVWMFGVCLWKEDIYREKGGRTIGRLNEVRPILKEVPAISVMYDGSLPQFDFNTSELRGPGPIHGQADFHLLILGRALSADWFFETARAYWEQFRPIVTTRVDYFDMMPYDKSLAVTLIIPQDQRDAVEQEIRAKYPNTYIDTIALESDATLERVARIFEMRAQVGRRFG